MSTCKRMWTDREIRSMAVHSVENKEDLKVFEHIVDKDGHKRFIDIDGTAGTIEGVTISYCKGSLSGTHLMVVVAGSVATGTTLQSGTELASFKLPSWVHDKIYPVWSTYIESKTIVGRNAEWSSQNFSIVLEKTSNNTLSTKLAGSVTATITAGIRIQFDLLIDDE